jgi:glycosyltransferase involved in cell wall biosynthesis
LSGQLINQHVVVVGLARDLATTLFDEVSRLAKVFAGFSRVSWLIIESDSEDDTPSELEKLQETIPNFEFVLLGNLRSRFPSRIERLAYCRNAYMQELSDRPELRFSDWIAVIDLDNATPLLDRSKVEEVVSSGTADAYSANQTGPYYDVFALRAKNWVEEDPFKSYRTLLAEGMPPQKAYKVAISSKMIRISEKATPIEVNSAFGGLTIYKTERILGLSYLPVNGRNTEECEHVVLNLAFRARGGIMTIAPTLTVAHYNQHTRYLKPSRRLVQPVISILRSALAMTLGEERAARIGNWLYKTTGL